MLEVRSVTKRFGGLVALADVTFAVEAGEVVGLVGPNGSGKSTLFGVISGFLRPESGQVFFGGRNVTGLAPHRIARLGVGRTFQIAQPLPEFTCLDAVALGILYANGERSLQTARKAAREVLEEVGLADFWAARTADLTMVNLRRLELARALSVRPKLLLLDEVFAGLTPAEIREATELIKRLKARRNLTVIMTEHIPAAILEVCTRVIVLDQGRILAVGSPAEIARDPRVIEVYLGPAGARGADA
jgi:branched-chain amino acid transport system ATP-binding protein